MAEGSKGQTGDALRLLVVEDDPEQCELLRLALAPLEVITAANGLDGLMKVNRVQPDCIIADIMMPEMDGWDFITHVRSHSDHRDMPVIYLTALATRRCMRRGYECGADLYLTKPWEADHLRRRIDTFIQETGTAPRPKRHTLEELALVEPSREGTPQVPKQPSPDPTASGDEPREGVTGTPDQARAADEPIGRGPRLLAGELHLPPRALLVSSDNGLQVEFRRAVDTSECEVLSATDSSAAIYKIASCQPDAVLIHWRKSALSVRALARIIAKSPDCKKMLVVLISDTPVKVKGREMVEGLYIFDVLQRPILPGPLLALLEDILSLADEELRQGRVPWSEIADVEFKPAARYRRLQWEG